MKRIMTSRAKILVTTALLIALLMVGPAGAYQEDFQSFVNGMVDRGRWKDEVFTTYPRFDIYQFDLTGISRGYINRIGVSNSGAPNFIHFVNYTYYNDEFNYLAWSGGYNAAGSIYLWGSGGVYINSYILGISGAPPGSFPVLRYELIRQGNDWHLYANGKDLGTQFTLATSVYGFELWFQGSDGYMFDNVVVGDSQPDIIGGLPTGWYLRKDMLSPLLRGTYNESGSSMSSTSFDLDWGVDSAGIYTIQIENADTGNIVNSSTWTAASDYSSGYAGNLTYNMVNDFVTQLKPYGLYVARLMQGSATLDSTYFWYLSSGATIVWDKDEYGLGDTATITTDVSPGYWDTATYTYTGKIIDLYGTVHDTWSITSQTQDEDIDLTGYAVGDYYAVIVATSGGTDYYMAFDIASINDKVNILGHTVNAYTGGVVPLTHVSFIQSGVFHNSVSGMDGSFNQTDLMYGSEIGVNATKTGFNHTGFAFTPPAAGTYTFNLSMLPDYIPNATAIVGIVYEDWSHNAIPGATVWISNGTWTGTSTTATSMGFYMFDGLAAGESYLINATASGYEDSVDYSRSPILGEHLVQNIEMTPTYVLGVECRDATSNGLITGQSIQVSSSDGQSTTTTSGIAQLTLDFGAYEITGSTEGYYVATRSVLMTGDRNITLSFVREADTAGAAAAGAAALHSVKFMVRDSNGLPIENAVVTAQGVETSVGPWTWLLSILGLSWTETPIHNATMSGTTDSRGEINFLMLPIVQYNMTFFKTGYINKNIRVYPKDDEYLITADATGKFLVNGSDVNTYINWTVSYEILDSTHANVTVSYRDNLSHTTSMQMNLTRTNASGAGLPEVHLGDWTWAGSGGHIITHSFTVNNYTGLNNSVWSRNRAVTSDFGTVLKDWGITFPVPGPLAPMGLPSQVLFFVAVLILFLVGMIFGATSVSMGAFVVCATAWVLSLGFRMMDYMYTVSPGGMAGYYAGLILATVVALFANVLTWQRKEGYP